MVACKALRNVPLRSIGQILSRGFVVLLRKSIPRGRNLIDAAEINLVIRPKHMWYHAIAYYGTKRRSWWNKTRDALASDVIVPFVTKQVVAASRSTVKSLFNFGAVNYITVVKTKERLGKASGQTAPAELADSAFLSAHEATHEFLDETRVAAAPARDRSLIQMALTPPQNRMFVVMKFGDAAMDSAFEGVYKPLGLASGFERVVRVDEIQDSGNISQQIVEHIATSRLIVADLSGERPNCYYEAGFAHALGKPIIFCIRSQDKVHFDLAAYRFIVWDTEASLRRQLKVRLESMAAEGSS